MEPSLEPQNAAPSPAAPHSNASTYTLVVGLVAIAIIAGAAYFLMGSDADMTSTTNTSILETAAPIQSNDSLSSSDEEAAIEADADEAYMQQLEADIDADLAAIDQY